MKTPKIILHCNSCGRVAVMESPAVADGSPLEWKQPAPAHCPACLTSALRLMPADVAPLNRDRATAEHAASTL